MIDGKIGAALILAAVVVALWTYLSERGRARRVRGASEIPPRRVLQAYNAALLRDIHNQSIRHGIQAQEQYAPMDYFELGRKLAAQGSEVCLDYEEKRNYALDIPGAGDLLVKHWRR